jgi:hypothetical protein
MRFELLRRTGLALGFGAVVLFGYTVPTIAQSERAPQERKAKARDEGQDQRDQRAQADQKKKAQQEEQRAKNQQRAKSRTPPAEEKKIDQGDQSKANQPEPRQRDAGAPQRAPRQVAPRQEAAPQAPRDARQGTARDGGREAQRDAGQQTPRDAGQQTPRDAGQQNGGARVRQAPNKPEQRRAEPERQALIRENEQRRTQYRQVLDRQQREAQQRAAQLQQQKRRAQYAFQQRYLARLRDQQARIQVRYDYDRDPFFYTSSRYRYIRGGRYYLTNDYGLDLLRQAVRYGYDEGFEAGRADREDGWTADYRNSYAYQDANYGYGGFYVERDDYNYYFREGFRRGYDDGYGARNQYGTVSNGKVAILAGVLAGIVTYELIRN